VGEHLVLVALQPLEAPGGGGDAFDEEVLEGGGGGQAFAEAGQVLLPAGLVLDAGNDGRAGERAVSEGVQRGLGRPEPSWARASPPGRLRLQQAGG
jgi:hypothetical protein